MLVDEFAFRLGPEPVILMIPSSVALGTKFWSKETPNYSINMALYWSILLPSLQQGTGSVTATYDTASKTLTWKGSYSSLTCPRPY